MTAVSSIIYSPAFNYTFTCNYTHFIDDIYIRQCAQLVELKLKTFILDAAVKFRQIYEVDFIKREISKKISYTIFSKKTNINIEQQCYVQGNISNFFCDWPRSFVFGLNFQYVIINIQLKANIILYLHVEVFQLLVRWVAKIWFWVLLPITMYSFTLFSNLSPLLFSRIKTALSKVKESL